MIAFANPDGLLLDNHIRFRASATFERSEHRPGTIWEGKYLRHQRPWHRSASQTTDRRHGRDHFFRAITILPAIAAPIFAPDASWPELLDASSDCVSRQAHTQALSPWRRRKIENGLFREHHRGNILIAFHNRGEYLHTLSAGLLAVDNEGKILAANRAAGILLHGLPASPGRRFADVFRTKFSTYLDEGRRKEPSALEDDVGSHFVSTIENTRQFPMIRSFQTSAPRCERGRPQFYPMIRRSRQLSTGRDCGSPQNPILIRGETGTGKEQLARPCPSRQRRTGAFVPVNCAALPIA